VLTWRRKRGEWSVLDIASADGRWTPEEVAAVETEQGITGDGVRRYLAALSALEGAAR
jgi:hypothetical protein